MLNATTFLSADEQQHIETAIREAEQQTSAEIVAVVATESGRYDRAESIAGLICSVLGLILLHAVANPPQGPGSWSAGETTAVTWQVVVVIVGFVFGSLLASYCHPLRRWLVRERELDEEVNHAARAVFTAQRLHSTRDAGGVLLYISLFERRAVVLADDGVVKKVGAEFEARLRDIAIGQLRAGGRAATFIETVKAAASELAGPLPRQEDDVNELPNHLVCIHPRP